MPSDSPSNPMRAAASSSEATSFEVLWTAEGGLGDGGWDLPERFELLRDLGDGLLGPVFVVRDAAQGDRRVRLEITESAHAPAETDRAALEESLRAASRVESPHVVRCLEVGRLADGRVFALREHDDGETLAERIAREGALHPSQALEIASQCLRGLESLHEAGLTHAGLSAQSVWLASQPHKSDDNPFGVAARLLDVGSSRRALGDGPQSDLRAVGELLAAMLGDPDNGSARQDAARSLADSLRADGAPLFASAEQVRIALEALLTSPRRSGLSPAPLVAQSDGSRAQRDALRSDASPAPAQRGLQVALAAAALGCVAVGWFAWQRNRQVEAAERAVAGERRRVAELESSSSSRIDALASQLSKLELELAQRRSELEAAQRREQDLRSESERAASEARANVERGQAEVTRLTRELERDSDALRVARLRLETTVALTDGHVRAARGLETVLSHALAGRGAQARGHALLLESEGLFGSRTTFVSSLAAASEGLERFEASRAAGNDDALDMAGVGDALAALDKATAELSAFLDEAAPWIEVELVDVRASARGRRVEAAVEQLRERASRAQSERAALHERDWAVIASAPGLQDPTHAFRHADRFSCEHLGELGARFARDLRVRVLSGDALDVGRLHNFRQLGAWAARVQRGDTRLPDELARELTLLSDAQRWYDLNPENDDGLDFSQLSADGRGSERKSWREELALQWRLSRQSSSFPLRAGQRAWRRAVDPSGRVEWWLDSVDGVEGATLRLRRARFAEDGRTPLGEGVLRIEHDDSRVVISGSTLPLVDLRAHGDAVRVCATPSPEAVDAPAELGLSPQALERVRDDAKRDTCLIYIQGDTRRWISPRLGLVREETRTADGVAVTQLVGLEP